MSAARTQNQPAAAGDAERASPVATPPDLRAPAGPHASGIALVDALERLRDGVEIFGPPLLTPDARGSRGDGPVHVAALRGDSGALLALAAAGARMRAPGGDGRSPERIAMAAGRPEIAALLAALPAGGPASLRPAEVIPLRAGQAPGDGADAPWAAEG